MATGLLWVAVNSLISGEVEIWGLGGGGRGRNQPRDLQKAAQWGQWEVTDSQIPNERARTLRKEGGGGGTEGREVLRLHQGWFSLLVSVPPAPKPPGSSPATYP